MGGPGAPVGHAGDGGGDVAPKVNGEALAARDWVHQLRAARQRHPQVFGVAHNVSQRLSRCLSYSWVEEIVGILNPMSRGVAQRHPQVWAVGHCTRAAATMPQAG